MATIDFPLQGVWQVVLSPADHVPSHYTEKLGMSHAFDFAKPEDVAIGLRPRLAGMPVQHCAGWGATVLSPCRGEVVAACNAQEDRSGLNLFADFWSGLRPLFFGAGRTDYDTVFGNYIVIQNEDYCCLLAHLKKDSLRVTVGDQVAPGDVLAQVGHSGSSQMPHLHIQLMDSQDLAVAKGVAADFNLQLECADGGWEMRRRFMPGKGARVKAPGHDATLSGNT